jgi:hypothetical protein
MRLSANSDLDALVLKLGGVKHRSRDEFWRCERIFYIEIFRIYEYVFKKVLEKLYMSAI